MSRDVIRTQGVCGGRARLFGTSIEICEVIRMDNNGAGLAELCEVYPLLTLGDLNFIRQYYGRHQAEVDEDMESKKKEETDG